MKEKISFKALRLTQCRRRRQALRVWDSKEVRRFTRRLGTKCGGEKAITHRTGAVLGPVLALGTAKAFQEKRLQLFWATSPSPDFLRGHSASPSIPSVAVPKLTRGLGDTVSRSPGDSAASAILALLSCGSHRPLRNLKRGGRVGGPALRHRASSASRKGARQGLVTPDGSLCLLQSLGLGRGGETSAQPP